MPIVFWAVVAIGFFAGAFLSVRWGGTVLAKIGINTGHERSIQRAGRMAGLIAAVPALALAIMIGGSLGGSLAMNFATQLPENSLGQQVVMGLGIGVGGMTVLCLLVVSTMAAAATFMKVHLAKDRPRK